jgi:acetate---CoA ligase (ADP-forming)
MPGDSERRVEMVRHLLHPASIAIVGASARPGGWSGEVFRNLQRSGYPGPVYPLNPRRSQIWDVPCYPDFAALPAAPDHLVVAVPSEQVCVVLKEGAAAGARSATVYAGGFGEGGDDHGAGMGRQLRETIEETGLAVSGPNCMGNLSAPARMVTLTAPQPAVADEGRVAIMGQSGGVVLYLNKALQHRGVPVQYAVTSGNEAGLTMADYVAYCAADPRIRVVAAFIESVRAPEAFFAACEQAIDSGTAVVALKIGGSDEGRQAALAHTGSLAGSLQAFDAVCGDLGVVRVDNVDEIVEAADFFAHAQVPAGGGVGCIVHSGGLRGLLLESAARLGISFPALAPSSVARLEALLPVGSFVGNPLDSGFGGLSSREIYFECIDILLADPNIGILLAQEQAPQAAEEAREENYIRGLNDVAGQERRKPIACFTMVSDGLTSYGRAVRRETPNLPMLQEVDKTLKTVVRAIGYARRRQARQHAGPDRRRPRHQPVPPLPEADTLPAGTFAALDEVRSKELLRRYGLPLLPEEFAAGPQEAVAAAARVGWPVVLKGVAGTVTHKSDLGLVVLNLRTAGDVAAAAREVAQRAQLAGVRLDGLLVARQGPQGLEVVVGAKRDPEVGPVVMFGAGGVTLELYGDVAFAGAGLSLERARELIGRTRVGRVLGGYRGGPRYDIGAVAQAIVAVSDLISEVGAIEEVDVNPFLVLEDGGGGFALDGLVTIGGRR